MPDAQGYENTSIEEIQATASKLRSTFATHKTRPVEYRLTQLKRLYWAVKDNTQLLNDACKQDIGKSETETYITEVGWVLNDIVFVVNNLKEWAKDETASDISFMNKPLKPKIRKDPLGAVFIIGTYNFPIQLALGPLIGAISAGCTAMLKPSEAAPAAAVAVQRIVTAALDPSAYTVVQGAVPETTAALAEKWDHIFYTGGSAVGKIVAVKAAETLTPVTLELGGRNPAIVTKNADLHITARRLLWGKTVNAGQVCVSQNYVLVDQDVFPTLVEELRASMKQFFPEGARKSPDYGKIVNVRQFQRLKKMLDESKGQVLIGGDTDEESRFIKPTVVEVSSQDDSLIVDESFGPIIPLLRVKNLDEAIRIANDVSGTPLGLYPFGNKEETSRILLETRSGGATINDSFFHASIPTLAFGGVGESGNGSYRGRASFDCFTHRRSFVATPGWMEKLLAARYPPFGGTNKLATYRRFTDLKPSFGRV
ncbi:MAG: hypothetical protein M1828_004293 [Chrysothrix sp. TS-e1954]|nr:MAG: hypothetical protein M1828_004293 [Chrysothrix sp. TS-e1954]